MMNLEQKVKSLHRRAIEKTDLAIAEKRSGNMDKYAFLLIEAYLLEKEAAHLCISEPTKLVLLNSAAALAMQLNLTHEPQR
jgi:hypothetical protein